VCDPRAATCFADGLQAGRPETWKFVSSPDDLNIIAAFNVAPGAVRSVSAVRCDKLRPRMRR
jgi:hypothetical protein